MLMTKITENGITIWYEQERITFHVSRRVYYYIAIYTYCIPPIAPFIDIYRGLTSLLNHAAPWIIIW